MLLVAPSLPRFIHKTRPCKELLVCASERAVKLFLCVLYIENRDVLHHTRLRLTSCFPIPKWECERGQCPFDAAHHRSQEFTAFKNACKFRRGEQDHSATEGQLYHNYTNWKRTQTQICCAKQQLYSHTQGKGTTGEVKGNIEVESNLGPS